MSCALLLYKLLHLLVIAAIGVLFGAPQKFLANKSQQLAGGSKSSCALEMDWLGLTCRLASNKSEWYLTNETRLVVNKYLHLPQETVPSETLVMAAICQMQGNPVPKNDDCSCSANFVTAATIMWSAAFVLTIVFDMVAIVTVHVMKVYWSPVVVVLSCLYTAFAILLWMIMGTLNIWYLVAEWPYTADNISGEKFKFYTPSIGWYIATGMCFVAAILPLLEMVLFFWLASRGKGRWRSLCSRKKDMQNMQRPLPAKYGPFCGKASPTNPHGEYLSMIECLESFTDERLRSSSSRSESSARFAKKSQDFRQKSVNSTLSPNLSEKEPSKMPKKQLKLIQQKGGAGRKH